jgi:hypothetical protein
MSNIALEPPNSQALSSPTLNLESDHILFVTPAT